MKKRTMKKYIPYGNYCYGQITGFTEDKEGLTTTGLCKNYVYHKTVEDAIVISKELNSKEPIEVPCKYKIYRCKYTGVTTEEDCCLYDQIKICGINESEDDWE